MLEFIRRNSTSFMSWLILGAIAVTMGITFGGPSDMLSGGGVEGLAEVYGTDIRNEDYSLQYNMASRFRMIPKDPEVREMLGVNEQIIDSIVERQIMVHEAEEMGLAATEKQAEDIVIAGHVVFFGRRDEWIPGDEKFNYELFSNNWLGPLRVAEPNYLEVQSDELLALTLRDLMSASVLVPESELRSTYEQSANALSLRYARYEFSAFTDLAEPTTAQLDAYVAEHQEELEGRYESQKSRFTGLPKQADLRLVEVSDTETERAALEQARTEIAAGDKTLAAVAQERSKHDTGASGGDYGWIDEQSDAASDLPEEVRAAIPGLTEGEVSEIVETEGSLWLLLLKGRREGDVPKEEALRELAEEGLRDELSRELAQRAAEEDQNAVAAGNPVADVFSQPGALGETTLFGGSTIEDLPIEGDEGADDDGDEGADDEGADDDEAAASDDAVAGLRRPKAELRSTGPFPKTRGNQIPGLGMVPGLVDDAWSFEGEAELLPQVYEVPGAFVLVGVESKDEASDEDFDSQRRELYAMAQRRKAQQVVGAWANRRCLDAKARGDIKVSEETIKRLTTYDTDTEGEEAKPKPPKPEFSVCSRVGTGAGPLGGMR